MRHAFNLKKTGKKCVGATLLCTKHLANLKIQFGDLKIKPIFSSDLFIVSSFTIKVLRALYRKILAIISAAVFTKSRVSNINHPSFISKNVDTCLFLLSHCYIFLYIRAIQRHYIHTIYIHACYMRQTAQQNGSKTTYSSTCIHKNTHINLCSYAHMQI